MTIQSLVSISALVYDDIPAKLRDTVCKNGTMSSGRDQLVGTVQLASDRVQCRQVVTITDIGSIRGRSSQWLSDLGVVVRSDNDAIFLVEVPFAVPSDQRVGLIEAAAFAGNFYEVVIASPVLTAGSGTQVGPRMFAARVPMNEIVTGMPRMPKMSAAIKLQPRSWWSRIWS